LRKKRFVCIGKVARVHGIKGEIKIFPFSRKPQTLCSYSKLYFAPEGRVPDEELAATGVEGIQEVTRCRLQGKYAIVALQGFADRDSAETLLGMQAYVERAALAELQQDEFYWHDLEGMTVVSDKGRKLGTVTALFSTASYDMLVVTGKYGEVMIPAVKEFISDIDQENNRLTVVPVDGLLEIND